MILLQYALKSVGGREYAKLSLLMMQQATRQQKKGGGIKDTKFDEGALLFEPNSLIL